MAVRKIALVGPGRAGKDIMAKWMNENTTLHYALSTSEVICPHIARKLGITEAEAFARRHEDRALWRVEGDRLREHDPAALARETLAKGDVCVGIRARVEIEAVRREGLVDLVVWVLRDTPEDPTLEFSIDMADIVIANNGTIAEFHGRLHRLARVLGILRAPA